MDLNYKEFGAGDPIVILHGLFGMLDNWQTFGKELAEEHLVYLVDQRNHGRSPHDPEHSYPLMAEDLHQFLTAQWIHRTNVLGHSMGGKTAMQLALTYPDLVEKLIVVDIAPKAYPGGHEQIFQAMLDLDVAAVESRQEAAELLEENIPERSVRQFLLKNLSRRPEGGYRWKMNLDALHHHYQDILADISARVAFEGPTLFVSGGKSRYIQPDDEERIRQLFPQAEIVTIEDAGHWLHAEAPDQLLRIIQKFLAKST